jgi:hypothetical protein
MIFNSTVYPSTMQYIPEMVKWAQQNIDRVHGLVFICFRTAPLDEEITYQTGEEIVDARHLSYASEVTPDRNITSYEVYDLIKEQGAALLQQAVDLFRGAGLGYFGPGVGANGGQECHQVWTQADRDRRDACRGSRGRTGGRAGLARCEARPGDLTGEAELIQPGGPVVADAGRE